MKMNKEIVMVRIADIIPNRFQPRLAFDDEALNDLANSIKEHGIIQPLILRDLGNKYEIIAGERRYKASQLAGVLEVPALIGQMDDQTSAELALIENIQRKDLSAIEEAKSYKKILDMGGFTQEELAKRMGKGQSTIANKMRLLSLTNEVQAALMNNLISERHARCLLQLKDENKQKEVLNKIIAERMNVRDTDNYIKSLLANPNAEIKEEPKEEESSETSENAEVSAVEPTKEPVEVPTEEEKKEEETENNNPNVYTQTDNVDFIDLNNLTPNMETVSEEAKEENKDNMQPVLDLENLPEISIEDTNSEEETQATNEEKEKDDDTMVEEASASKKTKSSDFSKIRLATAIRLAKDTLDDIKTAGYDASLKESEDDDSYQIIINIKKDE